MGQWGCKYLPRGNMGVARHPGPGTATELDRRRNGYFTPSPAAAAHRRSPALADGSGLTEGGGKRSPS